jgi:hypothetical protein
MTTLELYRKHKSGDVSREKFLYEVRRDPRLPWVLNTTSYDDAVKILKNKGIISETHNNDTIELNGEDFYKSLNLTKEDFFKKIYGDHELYNKAERKLNTDRIKDKINPETVKSRLFNDLMTVLFSLYHSNKEDNVELKNGMSRKQFFEDAIKKVYSKDNSIKESKQESKPKKASVDKGIIKHEKPPHVPTIDQVHPYEYRLGLQHELEESCDYTHEGLEKAKAKVLKNLGKNPQYYTNLLITKTSPIQFTEPKLDNLGFDGYSKAKGVKGKTPNMNKKDSDKFSPKEAKKSNPKGVKEMTQTPKKAKGIKKTMPVPGKPKVVKEELDKNVTPLQQYLINYESKISHNPEEFFDDIKKLHNIDDVKEYYGDQRGWNQTDYLQKELAHLIKTLNKKFPNLKEYHSKGIKLMDFFLNEAKPYFLNKPTDPKKYKIVKDSKGNIIKATNADGVELQKNDSAIAIDNGEKIKIKDFTEKQGKVFAIYNAGTHASDIDIDGLELSKHTSGVDLGKSFEKFKHKVKEDASQDQQAKTTAITAAGSAINALKSQLSSVDNDTSLNPDEKSKKKSYLQSRINAATQKLSNLKSGNTQYP